MLITICCLLWDFVVWVWTQSGSKSWLHANLTQQKDWLIKHQTVEMGILVTQICIPEWFLDPVFQVKNEKDHQDCWQQQVQKRNVVWCDISAVNKAHLVFYDGRINAGNSYMNWFSDVICWMSSVLNINVCVSFILIFSVIQTMHIFGIDFLETLWWWWILKVLIHSQLKTKLFSL